MFKKPGMGNASERMVGSERYDDGGDAERFVGGRGSGPDTRFTRGV